REEREIFVCERMPVVEYSVALADEPRAEDDIGLIVDDRLDELGILLGLVFEIGVLDDHDVTGGISKAGPKRSALALISFLVDDSQIGIAGLFELAEDFSCAVS